MKTKIILFVLFFYTGLILQAKETNLRSSAGKLVLEVRQPVINNLDSIIFDLSNSTLTATYIDIPVYLKSDDVIFSFDYAMKFNLTKLTFSTTIDLLPNDPSIISLSNFNASDLFLRYTTSSLQSFPSAGSIQVTLIRFALTTSCTPISAGDFTDILTILNGLQCSHRVTPLNFQQFVPTADFNSGATCLNTSIQFSNTSTIGSGSVTSLLWNFSNGSNSVLQNPSTTYTTTGAITTTLVVIASTGCTDTVIKFLNINPLPVSNFSYTYDCLKDSVFFTNTSTISTGTITGSLWHFGDLSGTSNLTQPSYHYNTIGIYTVTLLSTSNFSCESLTTVTVSLINKVSADFTTTALSNCIGSLINFSDASTYSLSTINAWVWDFGDGSNTNSNLQNPSHTYTTSGTYSITLTSTSADGCKGFITKTLTIDAPPVPQFGVTSATTCAVDNANFKDFSTTTLGSTFLWNFGDGGSSTQQNPTHAFTTIGVYAIKLTVTTPGGCSNAVTKTYTVVFPLPETSLFTNLILSNSVISFSNLTTNAVRVSWDFGDSQMSVQKNPIHTFPNVGTYKVCLTTYDSLDCVSESCKDIYVGLSRNVAVPSCFTPNFDNKNDVLKVLGGPLAEIKFQIFNQWGNLLFSSSSQDTGWDGSYNGEPQPVGAYKYILNGKTLDDKPVNIFGIVNLTR